MSIYLEEHPPARRQFRTTRLADPNGVYVLHTPEAASAASAARFIAARTDGPGSYLDIVDAGEVIEMGRPEWTMFHAAGHNSRTLSLAFGTYAARWHRLPRNVITRMIDRGAQQAAKRAQWLLATHGIDIPAVRLTREGAIAGTPGFIGHGTLDGPDGRRTDPGQDFPWSYFLTRYEHHRNQGDKAMAPQPTLKVSAGRSGTPLTDATDEVEALFMAYRRETVHSMGDIWAWGRDIAAKIYADPPIDIAPTLAYIRHALEQENSQ